MGGRNIMSIWISRWAGHWPVCIGFGMLATVMFTYLVPNGVADVTVDRTLAPQILDEYYLTWSPDDARQLLAALGAGGRRAYQLFYLKLDFWFPVLSLSVFYAALLSLAFPRGARFGWMNLLPVVMYVSDAVENLNHYSMAGSYPVLAPMSLSIGPYLTLTKYVLITGLPVIALAGFASRLFATLHKH
jgi:hypothetical protein